MNFKRIILISLSLCFIATRGYAIETTAKQVYLFDYDTGTVLLGKDYNTEMSPASMSKLMTLYMVFERLKDGRLSLDDEFTVSENAWKKGGSVSGSSTMFLPPKSKVKVSDLLRGVIIQSGNDACITIAENISGSEGDFAEEMERKAAEIGLTHSRFANATGWPNENQKMSAEDLAHLAKIIIKEFPEYYEVFSEKTFTYNNITQGNRNPLLYRVSYADGLKTGHTKESGYGLVGSAKKDGRRLIMVLNGLETNKDRASESEKVIRWGFREFDNYNLYSKGETVFNAEVWLGQKEKVAVAVDSDVVITIQKNKTRNTTIKAVYNNPIKVPITKGQKIGTLQVEIPDQEIKEFPLVAAEDVQKLGLFGKIIESVKILIFGK